MDTPSISTTRTVSGAPTSSAGAGATDGVFLAVAHTVVHRHSDAPLCPAPVSLVIVL